MPRIDCIVLDFDGTLTDVDGEAPRYLDSYRAALGAKIGKDLSAPWAAAQAHVLANSERYGWEFGGKIVAPAHADCYILAGCVGRVVLDELGLVTDAAERGALLDGLYRALYPALSPAWRPELVQFFDALLRAGRPVFVVTNSQPDAVKKKLSEVGSKLVEKLGVRGDAKKFALESPSQSLARFAALPSMRIVEGLPRPVYVRRGRYLEVLEKVWNDCGAAPDSTLVCGDIYEMDLAMPGTLGATVHLVTRPGTRAWEKSGALGQGGSVGASLLDALVHLS